jgi:hypothetical protein
MRPLSGRRSYGYFSAWKFKGFLGAGALRKAGDLSISDLQSLSTSLHRLEAIMTKDIKVETAAHIAAVAFASDLMVSNLGQVSGVNYSFRSTTTIIPDSCWNFVLSSPC